MANSIARLTAESAARLRSQPYTYPFVRGTAGPLPSGYHHVGHVLLLGQGAACFRRAADALLAWSMHERAGLRPHVDPGPLSEGSVAVLHFGWRRLSIPVPVRVAYVVAEAQRQGFAYGTLPGHPETGEESFVVEHRADDSVVFTITAFSRPARWFTRMGGPVARSVQRGMTKRYATELRSLTRGG